MKNIFQYQSYRKLLEDSYLTEKRSTAKATLASYAKGLGLSSSNFQMIVSGTRNLTVANIHAIAKKLAFAPHEREFFEALVLRDQAKDHESQSYYLKRINRLKSGSVDLHSSGRAGGVKRLRTSNKLLNSSQMAPVFLIYLLDFALNGGIRKIEDLDASKLAAKFGMSLSQTRNLLQAIQESVVAEKDFSEQAHIVFQKLTHKISEQDYILEEAGEAIRKIRSDFSNPDTFFRTFTLTMAKDDLPEFRADLIDLLETYIAKTPSTKAIRVIEKVFLAAYPALIE
jgi:hypothetical protein